MEPMHNSSNVHLNVVISGFIQPRQLSMHCRQQNKEYAEICLFELQDAVAVYDEILAYAEFLADGQAMNLEVPGPQDDGVLWSGLRLEDRAVLRLVSQGEGAAQLELEPWPGSRIELEAPTGGRTYLVRKVGEKVEVIE